jgi:hypothetical protein
MLQCLIANNIVPDVEDRDSPAQTGCTQRTVT